MWSIGPPLIMILNKEIQEFWLIVVKLTKEQISVCRLSGKFIPIPITFIDILDQMMAKYELAEG